MNTDNTDREKQGYRGFARMNADQGKEDWPRINAKNANVFEAA
jgi:hypothetical protein